MIIDPIKRAAKRTWTAFRSSVTGRFVTRLFAKLNPNTTVGEERER